MGKGKCKQLSTEEQQDRAAARRRADGRADGTGSVAVGGAGAGAGAGGPRKRTHKQKGAGTIVKSRGTVTNAGITMKDWQRTPKQLVHEFCQSQKRPRPFFNRAQAPPGKFRFRVCLPDPKKKEKNIDVATAQFFGSKPV